MKLKKISEFEWMVPVVGGMKVPGRIFSSENLVRDDNAVEQVRDVASLPGILGSSLAMPDIHLGYGFPIGGVAAFDLDEGVICPGGVGYDINCSVRLLKTNLVEADLKGREREILKGLSKVVPSGITRRKSEVRSLKNGELDEVLKGGAQWAVEAGYGSEGDWKHVEDFGKLEGRPEFVSAKAKGRGMNQLGTLGAGNHFLDVLVVDEVFDEGVAKVFGLEMGQVVIMIHCGSRGLGHQVASDYIRLMSNVKGSSLCDGEAQSSTGKAHFVEELSCAGGLAEGGKSKVQSPNLKADRLISAPIKSELGQRYFGAMNAAANFAFANKQVITHFVREEMRKQFDGFRAEVVYDICHNIAKIEKHIVDGKEREVLVMRKGATRAFGPGRDEVCEDYREVGQPVLLPGSMGTSSYVLVGSDENKAWGSCAHGAGRVRSRSEAGRKMSFEEAVEDMEKRGVFVEGGKRGMVEESPFSYKDVDEVVRVCCGAGLVRKVVSLRPKLVLIG